jgi:hypothetical protein
MIIFFPLPHTGYENGLIPSLALIPITDAKPEKFRAQTYQVIVMTAFMFSAILITGLAIVPIHPAIAQMGEHKVDALRGLTSISIVVDSLDEDERRCGITEQLIRDAFLYPIGQSRIRLSTSELEGPVFWVRVTTLIQRQPNQCISAVEMRVFRYHQVQLDYAPPMGLWDAATIIVGDRHAERLGAAVESATKRFVTTWNLANRP